MARLALGPQCSRGDHMGAKALQLDFEEGWEGSQTKEKRSRTATATAASHSCILFK